MSPWAIDMGEGVSPGGALGGEPSGVGPCTVTGANSIDGDGEACGWVGDDAAGIISGVVGMTAAPVGGAGASSAEGPVAEASGAAIDLALERSAAGGGGATGGGTATVETLEA